MPLPYTFMYVSGLKLGLTTEDLRHMPYNRLANMIFAWNEATAPPKKKDGGSVIDATQAHIDSILG